MISLASIGGKIVPLTIKEGYKARSMTLGKLLVEVSALRTGIPASYTVGTTGCAEGAKFSKSSSSFGSDTGKTGSF